MTYSVLRLVLLLIVVAGLVACEKRAGEGVVLEKEHIDAAVPPTPGIRATVEQSTVRPVGEDEITVDSYAMKPEVRGTGRDPRALKDEQWLVKVRMISDNRTFHVPAEKGQFESLKAGDRVQVRYRVGKYTGTVWGAEITGVGK